MKQNQVGICLCGAHHVGELIIVPAATGLAHAVFNCENGEQLTVGTFERNEGSNSWSFNGKGRYLTHNRINKAGDRFYATKQHVIKAFNNSYYEDNVKQRLHVHANQNTFKQTYATR